MAVTAPMMQQDRVAQVVERWAILAVRQRTENGAGDMASSHDFLFARPRARWRCRIKACQPKLLKNYTDRREKQM
jgi:hypothetical protein